jgi:hypothetical protein
MSNASSMNKVSFSEWLYPPEDSRKEMIFPSELMAAEHDSVAVSINKMNAILNYYQIILWRKVTILRQWFSVLHKGIIWVNHSLPDSLKFLTGIKMGSHFNLNKAEFVYIVI